RTVKFCQCINPQKDSNVMALKRGLSLCGEEVEDIGGQDIKWICHGTPSQVYPLSYTEEGRINAPENPNLHDALGPNPSDKRNPLQPLLFLQVCAATCARLWLPDICPTKW